jgi:hypothetical protein
MLQQLLRRLRLRHKTSPWAVGPRRPCRGQTCGTNPLCIRLNTPFKNCSWEGATHHAVRRTTVHFILRGVFYPNKIRSVGTNFGLLVYVLPGPNKRIMCRSSMVFSLIRGQKNSPAASFVLPIPFSTSYFCDSRCPFGRIEIKNTC